MQDDITFECENCGKMINNLICESCNFDNINEILGVEEKEINCCENCIEYKPNADWQCIPMAKRHRWDRKIFEIDTPDTFVCNIHRKK